MDCIHDTGSGLACKECKENVESINRIMERQIKMYGSTHNILKQRMLFYIAFAVFFILTGFQMTENRVLFVIFIAMGILFLLMSINSHLQQKKLE